MTKKNIVLLEWDTSFYRFKPGEIIPGKTDRHQLPEILTEARLRGYKLLYSSFNPADSISNSAALKNNGFLADEKITFVKSISDVIPNYNEKQIKEYTDK